MRSIKRPAAITGTTLLLAALACALLRLWVLLVTVV